jgi:hypothetical protein
MIVETTLGTALRIAALAHAHVHGIDGRRFAPGKRMADEQFPQGFSVDLSSPEGSIKAAPAAAMRRLEAQVNGRRDAMGAEESIGPRVKTFVEGVTEGGQSMKSVGGLHNVPIMHSPKASRIPYPPVALKRRLRGAHYVERRHWRLRRGAEPVQGKLRLPRPIPLKISALRSERGRQPGSPRTPAGREPLATTPLLIQLRSYPLA